MIAVWTPLVTIPSCTIVDRANMFTTTSAMYARQSLVHVLLEARMSSMNFISVLTPGRLHHGLILPCVPEYLSLRHEPFNIIKDR